MIGWRHDFSYASYLVAGIAFVSPLSVHLEQHFISLSCLISKLMALRYRIALYSRSNSTEWGWRLLPADITNHSRSQLCIWRHQRRGEEATDQKGSPWQNQSSSVIVLSTSFVCRPMVSSSLKSPTLRSKQRYGQSTWKRLGLSTKVPQSPKRTLPSFFRMTCSQSWRRARYVVA